jgi:serine O-acetyltransferase
MRSLPAKPGAHPSTWPVETVVSQLRDRRWQWRERQNRNADRRNREFPSFSALEAILLDLQGVLFPLRLGPDDLTKDGEDFYVAHTLHGTLGSLQQQIQLELDLEHSSVRVSSDHASHEDVGDFNGNTNSKAAPTAVRASYLTIEFAKRLPHVRELIDEDVIAAFRGDPAASSVDEVLLCYPGILAIIHQRLANVLYRLGLPMMARMMTEIAHRKTGIDIHPGAQIGPGFFIDHGTGVVIGETCVIGSNVRIYQAVTLGAKRFNLNEDGSLRKGEARHPIVEEGVVIYAGASILGRVRIGARSIIGGNVWLTQDVPADSRITQGEHSTQSIIGANASTG